jgi:hypothetical protein
MHAVSRRAMQVGGISLHMTTDKLAVTFVTGSAAADRAHLAGASRSTLVVHSCAGVLCHKWVLPKHGTTCNTVVEQLHTHLYGIKGGGLVGRGPALNVSWGVGSALKMLRTG